MIRYNIATIFLLLLAFLAQQLVPVFSGLSHSRLFIVHLVFLCTAVTVATPTMLILSLIAGVLWDAHSSVSMVAVDTEIYPHPVETMRFGYSILLFAGMGFLTQGLKPLFCEGKWYLSALLTGVTMFLYLNVEHLLISFVRGNFVYNRPIIEFVGYTSLLTVLVSPLFIWGLYSLAKLFNYSLFTEVDRQNPRYF